MAVAANYPLAGAPQLALSGGPQVYRVFTPVSQTDMVDQLAAALLAAAWTFDSLITHGQRLIATSPQGYTMRVDIWWIPGTVGNNPVLVQLVGAASSGRVNVLDFQDGCTYQIVANPCGAFISRPGVRGHIWGSALSFGIPRMDDGCGFGTDIVTEVWFSFNDAAGSPFFQGSTPRASLDITPYSIGGAEEGNYNGALVNGGPSGGRVSISGPRIPRISSGCQADYFSLNHPVWVDGVPILYPAFVAWGNNPTSNLRIRGQVYDAVCRSKSYDADDATATFDSSDWICYTLINHSDRNFESGSLWLITRAAEATPPVVNVAY
jgi:hypothetical protein